MKVNIKLNKKQVLLIISIIIGIIVVGLFLPVSPIYYKRIKASVYWLINRQLRYYNGKQIGGGGPPPPPVDKDVPYGYPSFINSDPVERVKQYAEYYYDKFDDTEIWKIGYYTGGTITILEYKSGDYDYKYGETNKIYFSAHRFFIKVRIDDGWKNAVVQMRDGVNRYEQIITLKEYREVLGKLITEKYFDLDLPTYYLDDTDAYIESFMHPVKDAVIFEFCQSFFNSQTSTQNENKIKALRNWMIAKFPDIKNHPTTQFTTEYGEYN